VPSPRFLFLVIVFIAVGFGVGCGSKSDSGSTTSSGASVAVHPCDTSAPDPFGVEPSQLRATAEAASTTSASASASGTAIVGNGTGLTGQPGCDGPDFSQRCPFWASQEYDSGSGSDIGCGTTIAQCGCAMTSAASLLVRYGVTRGPDGQPTNPQTLNEWFNADGQETDAGTLSRGYVYGAVNWLAVADYARQAAAQFGTPSLAFNGNLNSDIDALKRELDNSRPVILEEPGHYILATGTKADDVAIADPYYVDRTDLKTGAYHDAFVSGRLYRPGSDMSAFLVAAPKGVQISVRDPSGSTVGFKNGSQQPVSEVKQSQFALEPAWQDPTCTAVAPKQEFGVSMATLLLPPGAHYEISVQGAASSKYSFAVYAYDQAGGLVMHNFEGNLPASGDVHFDLDYDPAPGSSQSTVQVGGTPPTGTPASGPGAPATTAPSVVPTQTPTPGPTSSSTITPTATQTPTATPTPTVTPSPAANIVMQLFPAPDVCKDDTSVTAVAFPTDANGKIPATTQVDFSVSPRGAASPMSLSTSNGRAEVIIHPGPNPNNDSVVITVTATVHGTAISISGTFTCPGPTIL
jgi:Peptidase_C39 like family